MGTYNDWEWRQMDIASGEAMDALADSRTCGPCRKFFARYQCGRNVGRGECDCPKCQGYCKCEEYEDDKREPDELEQQTRDWNRKEPT